MNVHFPISLNPSFRLVQFPLNSPFDFAQERSDSVRMTGLRGVGEDESVEGIH